MAEHEAAAEETVPEAASAAGPVVVDLGLSAATLALAKRRRRAGGDDRLEALLEKQARMLDAQLEDMHEQRELQLSRLRWGRFSDRMRAALQLLTILAGLAVAVVLAGAAWEAARSDSVVVDAFHGPPALAAQGLDGTMVATGVLDQLERLQEATRISRAKRGIKDAWSGDIRLDVPETGVSIGEIRRYLHEWLGHETHISGDLLQTPQGLSLTVRGVGIPARTFDGTDLKMLSVQAAEYIYGGAEPYAFSSFLISGGRDKEALAFLQTAYPVAKPQERPFLLSQWGNALLDSGRAREALPKHEQAVRLKPDYWVAWSNVVSDHLALADEEGAARAALQYERLAHRSAAGAKSPPWLFVNDDILFQDWSDMRAGQLANIRQNSGGGSSVVQAAPILAISDAILHDPRQADDDLESARDAENDPFTAAMMHFVRGWAALDRGDWPTAATEMEPFGAAYANPAIAGELPGLNCWVAPAEEMAGRPDKADAAIKAGGRYVDCYRFRADILDHRGDWLGARKAYAEAVGLAPDLPAGYYSWGLALARHGDLNGAIAKYALAHQKGPRWADPLKAWGDALAAQHRYAEAEARYAEAGKLAPQWPALKAARDHASRALAGRRSTG